MDRKLREYYKIQEEKSVRDFELVRVLQIN